MAGQERALLIGRLPEPHLVAGAVDVLFLEGLGRQTDELSGSFEISFG